MRSTGNHFISFLLRSSLIFSFLLFGLGHCVLAQSQGISHIKWEKLAYNKTQVNKSEANGEWYIETREPVSKRTLADKGLTVLRVLDDTHYIVETPGGFMPEGAALHNVRAARPEWKLSPALLSRLTHLDAQATYTFHLSVDDTDRFLAALHRADLPVQVLKVFAPSGEVVLRTSPGILHGELLPMKSVRYAGEQSVPPTEESYVLDLNLNPNRVNAVWAAYPDLTGEDILISVKEQLFRAEDIDIRGRTVPSGLEAPGTTTHATEMATIIAGAGNSFIKGKGAAWQASLSSSSFEDVAPDPLSSYLDLGITIQNHSYGTRIENFYGATARSYDASAIAIPELLHVFSAGNSGTRVDTSAANPYKDLEYFANLTGNFKMAKNILTVGAVNIENEPEILVSRGPAYDGRVKPELVAYSSFGSSNSAAIVSGIAALMQQREMDLGRPLPSAELLRAYLINTANDVHTPQVDFITGYGNVNALRAVKEISKTQRFQGTITDGQTISETITLPAGATNLKVTLVWADAPALANAAKALVNDLDLRVQKDSDTWLPWKLNITPDSSLLTQPAQRGEDHLNTIEQVTLATPQSGTYTLTIEGTDIPEGPQTYSIVYQYDEGDSFTWTSPGRLDNFPYDGESSAYFRWDTNLTGTGTIEFSTDGGATWQTMAENVDLAQGFYRVAQPEGHGPAMARMVTNDQTYVTELFTIGDLLNVDVGFACGDSLMLKWEMLEEAIAYRVYNASGPYLDTVAVTADTVIILTRSDYATRMMAVQPIYADGKDGLINPAFDYAFQGVECYVSTFIPRTLPEVGVQLTVKLGTSYGIREITFSREEGDTYVPLGTVSNMAGDSAVFVDTAPLGGPNYYLATLYFENGEVLNAGPVLAYYLSDIDVLVFPNPVLQGEEITIFTREFEGEYGRVSIYNTNGQLVFREPIITNVKFVPTERFTPGLYLYEVEVDGRVKTGRIMVE